MAATEFMSLERLPQPWNYGVTEDGRVFFINEETRRSTWIHPVKKHPVQSGHTSCHDVPLGWEKSVTAEGATYYVDHLNERTTFHHPVTGETTAGPTTVFQNRSIDGKSDTDSRGSPGRRRSPKQKVIDKPPSPSKRSVESEVAMQGWLHKQDSGGLKSWRRRWFVLADFCLFYHKGPEESNTLGSILLPSYHISPCTREDGISRKFAFKAEHENMRTYYFSADSKEEMTQWINALGLATVLQRDPSFEEEHRRRLRDEEEAGFHPSQTMDGSLGSDHRSNRSNSSGARDDPYRNQYPPGSTQDDPYRQQSYTHHEPYPDENGFNPYDNRGADQYTTQPNRGFSTYSDHSPTQPSRDSGYISNRNSRPSHFEPDHSRQSSDSYFNQNQLNKAQEDINVDKMNASFEKSPFFSPKHKQKERQGMNLRPLSDLFNENESKGRDENFNMKPSQYPHNNSQQYEGWENTPQSRYSYDAPSHQRKNNDPYGASDVDYDAYTGRDPRLYKGYSENLAQPQSQWQDLKTPQERQEKLRSDRYGTLSENGHPEAPAGSSSPRQPRRDVVDRRPPHGHNQNSRGFDGLQREDSHRQSYDRVPHPTQAHPQSMQNPIYENLNTSYDGGPGRPPLPAAYRDRIVQELAQTKTPGTRHDMLIASQTELKRLNEPTFFQFPEVSPLQSQSSPTGPQQHQQLQRQDQKEDYQPNYADGRRYQQQNPDRNWASKNPDYKRQSLDRASQRSDSLYSTIPGKGRGGTVPQDIRVHGRRKRRDPFPVDPSSPFRPINVHEGKRYHPHQVGSPVKPIPIKEAKGAPVEAAPRRSRWIEEDDGGFGTPGKAKRSLFASKQDTGERGRRRTREPKTEMQPRAKSLNAREVSRSVPTVFAQQPRPTSMDRSAAAKESDRQKQHTVQKLTPSPIGQRKGAFVAVNPPAKSPDRSFYDHQPHKYWTPRSKADRQQRRERAKTIDVAGAVDFNPPYLPNLSEARRANTTGDLTRISAFDSPQMSSRKRSSRVGTNETSRKPKDAIYSPAILRRKPNMRRDRPKSMPNDIFNSSTFMERPKSMPNDVYNTSTFSDANNSRKRANNRYDYEDAPLIRPDKRFDLFPEAQNKGANQRSQMSPLPNKERVMGRADARNQYAQNQQYYQSQPPAQQQQNHGSQAYPVSPALGGRKFAPQNLQQFDIDTIKEDPNMPESDILQTQKLQTLQNQLNGHRLRLSVTAGDLIGKSHEEMVLLLIQLRRSQSRLEDARNWYRTQMQFSRGGEKEYKRQRSTSIGRLEDALENEHEQFVSLRKNTSELDKQLDVHKPLVNLLDNLVTMGSLYGGDNMMLTSQYKKDRLRPGEYIPPKKMIEFSRKHQEDKLVKEQEDELRQLTEDEVDLEEKLDELYKLDRELQEHSFNVSSLQEDRELLEKALHGIKQQQDTEQDGYALERLLHQRKTVDNELSKVRQQLAESSKILEETAVENARVENEVMLLRKRIAQSLNRSNSFPNLSDESARTKQKLEQELTGIQSIMEGLNKQGAKLSRTMASLRHSNPDLTQENKPPSSHKKESTYAETDLDSMQTTDLATYRPINIFKGSNSNLSSMPNQPDGRPLRRDQPPAKPPHTINHQKFSQPLSVQTSVPYRTYSGHNKPAQNLSYNNNSTLNSYRGSGDYNDNSLSPQDITEADDNTKRFYGLLPKDRPRVTVRDVKKRESERRSKRYNGDSDAEFSDVGNNSRLNGDRDSSIMRPKSSADLIRKGTAKLRRSRDERRQSATERLFPKNPANTSSASDDASRRFSDLVNPRPFSARPSSLIEPMSKSSTDYTYSSPNTVAKVRPVSSYTANSRTSAVDGNYERRSPTTVTVKPLSANSYGDTLSKKDKIRERHKGAPRGRFLTVSSSSPVKLEQSPTKREFKHTAAGDLIIPSEMDDDVIRGDKKDDIFDPYTIDREVLFMPEKVEIPERYIPESDDEEEQLTEEEKQQRREKAKQMRKLVAAQSLQDWTKDELDLNSGDMHRNLVKEKKRREQVLDIRQALAKEVTQKTREIAERSMLEATSPTGGGGISRTASQRRRSELQLHTDNSPNISLRSPPSGEEYHAKHKQMDAQSPGYESNPLTNQVLYYGPEVMDNTQEHLDMSAGSMDMGLCS